jgi:hypothetical protein
MSSYNILEQRITEAVDGKLSPLEVEQLQEKLRSYPELQEELSHQLRGIPVLLAYTDVQPDPFAVSRLRNKIKTLPDTEWQFEIIFFFKRYVLAAGLTSLLLVSVLHMIPQEELNSDSSEDEISMMLESIESEALDWAPNSLSQEP